MSPSIILGFVLGSLYGLIFFIIFGQGWFRFTIYWVISVVGFFLGQWIGGLLGLAVFNVGEVHFVEGTVVSCASLWTLRLWRHR
jgi:hypothetical protein